MYKKGENSWARFIKKRKDENRNFLGFFTGETGSSKSWSSMTLATKLDPEFSVDQVCFTILELMERINDCNNPETVLGKKKYKVLMLEETQTSLSNKEWQSKINKLFNYVASTFRNQNIILLFNAPYMNSVDSGVLKLMHAMFECRGWSKSTGISTVRAKILQYNARKNKFYEHSLHVIRDKKVVKMMFLHLKAPPKQLIKEYELKKTNFTNKLNKSVYEDLMRLENNKKGSRKKLTDQQSEVMENIAKYGIKEAIEHLGLARATVYEHKKAAEVKGYSLKEFGFTPIQPPKEEMS